MYGATKRTGKLALEYAIEQGYEVFTESLLGALSILYAAVSEHVNGGNMYGPEENRLRGYPTLANLQENVMNEKVAEKLGRPRKK